jgi:hypothetical protein
MRHITQALFALLLLLGPPGRLSADEPTALAPEKTASEAPSPQPEKPIGPNAAEVARQADVSLDAELFADQPPKTPLTGDQFFLRRVSLDLIGRNPTTRELKAFTAGRSPQKRSTTIDRLLADKRFGENWGRYWRNVILSRQVDPRAFYVSRAVYRYFADTFNTGGSWDELARAFVTAEGNVSENGNTAIYMAQMGRTSETAAEISRIFMGVQIQCAQCHDHPWDRWKREQFHQFAAFFPRVRVSSIRNEENRRVGYKVATRTSSRRYSRFRRSGEHYMPSLENPRSRGRMMQPVLFATDQKLRLGISDKVRRESLARWMTSPDNPWFARAFVNRTWGELIGEGFYEPLDDLGPDRTCNAPKTLDLLAKQFVASGHDIKWLFRTITNTRAYQRESRPRRQSDETPFAASCPQPLRAEQVYNSLVSTLGLDSSRGFSFGRSSSSRSLRSTVTRIFGFDPSLPRGDVTRSIPQKLFLMNSRTLNRAINAKSTRTVLGRLVASSQDDRAVTTAIYRQTFAREPTDRELQTCLKHVRQTGDRAEAFEDIQWALVNSTEFLHRR